MIDRRHLDKFEVINRLSSQLDNRSPDRQESNLEEVGRQAFWDNSPPALLSRLSSPATHLELNSMTASSTTNNSSDVSTPSWNPVGRETLHNRKRLLPSSTSYITGDVQQIQKRRKLPDYTSLLSRMSSPSGNEMETDSQASIYAHSNRPQTPSLIHRLTDPETNPISIPNLQNTLIPTVTPRRSVKHHPSVVRSTRRSSPGTTTNHSKAQIRAVLKQTGCSNTTKETSSSANHGSGELLGRRSDSHLLSGSTSCEVNPSTSTSSSQTSTALNLLRKALDTWEELKYDLSSPNQRKRSKHQEIGIRPSTSSSELLSSPSHTEKRNSGRMLTTSKTCSLPSSQPSIRGSSCMTTPSAQRSVEVNKSSSLTSIGSRNSLTRSSYPMEETPKRQLPANAPHQGQIYATDSTVQLGVPTPIMNVATAMPADNVNVQDTTCRHARENKIRGSLPKYLRYNIWPYFPDCNDKTTPTTTEWSVTAKPLPSPPSSEFTAPGVRDTIKNNPNLFKIVTPLNIDLFESLLAQHPNQPFVNSVVRGFREGFWPWADTQQNNYPITYDASLPPPSDPIKASFIRSQIEKEVQNDRFSQPFGPELLPGMYSTPVYAVPKPRSDNLRMVTDHSASQYSLNSMIDHKQVTGCPLDNMHHLGQVLIVIRELFGDRPLNMFKCDISEAYRIIPLHPLWQIKQVNTFGDQHWVDRNATFGSSSSPLIFISFNSLVSWIAKHVKNIQGLSVYGDDTSGAEFVDNDEFYQPYNKLMPRKQVNLLRLWDELCIPHSENKQLSGSPLTIIGIQVDPNSMTLTLPDDSRLLLIEELRFWSKSSKPHKTSFKLKKWQQLAGWVNWSLNVFPLLRPCLNNFYSKISGNVQPRQRIYVNDTIRSDLSWAADHLERAPGVHLLSSTTWKSTDADFTIYCDASLSGLGFWYPDSQVGYHSPIPYNVPSDIIFYFEALCVVSALHHCVVDASTHLKIVIYTDNLNTVDIFNTLKCKPRYNNILIHAVDLLLSGHHNLRVLYVPTQENDIADALSRTEFGRALDLVPNLTINPFQPPLLTLGAAKK
jgi:hypothetical protein